jgi:hypothetical protein
MSTADFAVTQRGNLQLFNGFLMRRIALTFISVHRFKRILAALKFVNIVDSKVEITFGAVFPTSGKPRVFTVQNAIMTVAI